jgi:apolipoprotein N-acyltransferase
MKALAGALKRWAGSPLACSPVLALIAGLVHTASFAPTYAWPLQVVALALLVNVAWNAVPRRAAFLGLLFGLGWMVSGLWWLYISMHDFGRLPAWVAALAVLLLSAFLSLYYAGALAALAALRARALGSGGMAFALQWAGVWLLAELARGTWLSGFPWIASGYAHTLGPLAAWAPWVGVYGLGFLAVAWAAAAVWALRRSDGPGLRAVAVLTLVVGVAWVLPAEFTQSSGRVPVALLQPNVPQDQKFDVRLIMGHLDSLAGQMEQAPPGLVVTPESAVPLAMQELPREFLERLHAVATRSGAAVLWGTFTGDEQQGFMNSVVGLSAAVEAAPVRTAPHEPYVYGKRHLLPFGETIPWGFHSFVRAMGIPMDDQRAGDHDRPFVALGQRFRPLICYEDLFGEEIAASVAQGGATVLVNFSNLAWFGRLMVQDQHLQFSQMRSLELQRPLIRSTNTGATAVIDHRGRVTHRLPAWQRGTLVASVEGRSGVTPLAWWLSRLGLWPLWVLGLVAALSPLVWARLHRGPAPESDPASHGQPLRRDA